jgi:peptidoglycan hydrolase CwlO-like protein
MKHIVLKILALAVTAMVTQVLLLGQTAPPSAPAVLTKEAVQQRLTELKKQKEQVLADVNALSGAIQDCEYWLEELNKKLAPPKQEPPSKQDSPATKKN